MMVYPRLILNGMANQSRCSDELVEQRELGDCNCQKRIRDDEDAEEEEKRSARYTYLLTYIAVHHPLQKSWWLVELSSGSRQHTVCAGWNGGTTDSGGCLWLQCSFAINNVMKVNVVG